MLNREKYENEFIALGITDIDKQQEILNQLYIYVTIVNDMYNEL